MKTSFVKHNLSYYTQFHLLITPFLTIGFPVIISKDMVTDTRIIFDYKLKYPAQSVEFFLILRKKDFGKNDFKKQLNFFLIFEEKNVEFFQPMLLPRHSWVFSTTKMIFDYQLQCPALSVDFFYFKKKKNFERNDFKKILNFFFDFPIERMQNFFSLCYSPGIHGFPQQISTHSVQPFCQPKLTNIQTNIYERRSLLYR